METTNPRFTFKIERKDYKDGFGHKATLYDNGQEISVGRSRWQNRTWERRPFDTAKKNAIMKYLKEQEVLLTKKYREERGVQRVPLVAKAKIWEDTLQQNEELFNLYKTF